jgi:hypothetical protein
MRSPSPLTPALTWIHLLPSAWVQRSQELEANLEEERWQHQAYVSQIEEVVNR